jgi:hypothetical protein
MNPSPSTPLVRSAGLRFAMRWFAFSMLAAMILCVPDSRTKAGNPADVPSINGNMGPCTAEFNVVDASSKPVFDAKIHVKFKYGFMSKKDTDLEIGTNSEGRARMEGLPDKLKKPPMEFSIRSGESTKTVTNDPAGDCHPTFNVTLGK